MNDELAKRLKLEFGYRIAAIATGELLEKVGAEFNVFRATVTTDSVWEADNSYRESILGYIRAQLTPNIKEDRIRQIAREEINKYMDYQRR